MTLRQMNYHFISEGNVAKVWNAKVETYEEAIVTGFYPGTQMVKLTHVGTNKTIVKSPEELYF